MTRTEPALHVVGPAAKHMVLIVVEVSSLNWRSLQKTISLDDLERSRVNREDA